MHGHDEPKSLLHTAYDGGLLSNRKNRRVRPKHRSVTDHKAKLTCRSDDGPSVLFSLWLSARQSVTNAVEDDRRGQSVCAHTNVRKYTSMRSVASASTSLSDQEEATPRNGVTGPDHRSRSLRLYKTQETTKRLWSHAAFHYETQKHITACCASLL